MLSRLTCEREYVLPRSKNVGSGPRGVRVHPSCSPCASEMHACEDATSTAARRLDCSDVDLFHLHHRIERALGGSSIGIGYRFCQSQRRNLARKAHLSLHQPHALSSPPLPTIAFQ